MKKCPFCAEEIKDEAVKCKHCGSNVSANNKKVESKPIETKQTSMLGPWMPILKVIGIILGVLIAFSIWYISIPAVLLWYLWAKTKLSKRTKILITAVPPSLLVLLFIIFGIISSLTPPPVLAMTEPQDGTAVFSKSILLKGKVEPADVTVEINGQEIPSIDKATGNFSFQYDKLAFGNNDLKIEYRNMHSREEVHLSITRNATPEEQAELDRQKAEAEAKAKAAAEAKLKAQADSSAQAQAEADAKARAESDAQAEMDAKLEEFRQGRYNAERNQQMLNDLESWRREAEYQNSLGN